MAVNHISFSHAFLPITVFLLAVISSKTADAAINSPFCSRVDPQRKQLCNTVVNGAPTREVALANVLNAVKKETAPVAQEIANLPNTLPGSVGKEVKGLLREDCNRNLDSFNYNIARILEILENGATFDDNFLTWLNAMATSLHGCIDVLEMNELKSPQVQKYVDIATDYSTVSFCIVGARNITKM
ncbi:OLC1v1028359C1 [Oldenlandia corymbosa var. corymbosa]|uniref:OLC1v1028359C1 n=1 Tax=Oldenlandia corymbosa var. corymbosa TaxID=529605 RepID=A0AAV1CCP5_OLDCO|nr:OLC1v1028359C1 [Oldenlandia corymbosa var. corymbosa]